MEIGRARRPQKHALSLDPTVKPSSAGVACCAVPVQTFAHFLAGFEKRHALLIDRYMGASARIAAGAGRAMFYRKRAETTQLDPVAARQRGDDLIENRVANVLDMPLGE